MQSSANHSLTIITPPDHSFAFEKNILAVDLGVQQQKDLLNWAFDQGPSCAIWSWDSGQSQDQVWLLNAAKLAHTILINANDRCLASTLLISMPNCYWLESSTMDHSLLTAISKRSIKDITDLTS